MRAYAEWLVRWRVAVLVAAVAITATLGTLAASLKIVIDPSAMAPKDDPIIQSAEKIDAVFGSRYLVVIAVSPKRGDIFQPVVLDTVKAITRRLESLPVVEDNSLISLASVHAKAVHGQDGALDVHPLLPLDGQVDLDSLRRDIDSAALYRGTIVSNDRRSTAIVLELKEGSDGFRELIAPVIKAATESIPAEVDVRLGGNAIYMSKAEEFAARINILFPIAIVVIALLHLEAFRTVQGLVLPLVTALIAVVWGMGLMGVAGQPLDIFNSPTPIMILAIAAGHAVQILKRYYEEYATALGSGLEPSEANRSAVIESVTRIGPVMIAAGTVAACGFFSLMAFRLEIIRNFGLFAGLGIVSAVVVEMTVIPALRSFLPAPKVKAKGSTDHHIWSGVSKKIATIILSPSGRTKVWMVTAAIAGLCFAGTSQVQVNNSNKEYFSRNIAIQRDDAYINQSFGGTNAMYIMVRGAEPDAVKSPRVLSLIEGIQDYATKQRYVGKIVSIVDQVKRVNMALHDDDPTWSRIPDTRDEVSQDLLLYSMSSSSNDMSSLIDEQADAARLTVLLRTDDEAYIGRLVGELEAFAADHAIPGIQVTFGGDMVKVVALTNTMVHGKIINIVQIALAILMVSALLFRSAKAGFIVLAPLVMAVMVVFGVMGLCSIPLNIPNSLISAMAVGIGADYAIYLLYRIREQVCGGAALDDAIAITLQTAGKATLFVATAVAGGYSVLMLSIGYNVHIWLSIFIVIAMLVSAVASLILVPSLVIGLRPAFIFNPRSRNHGWAQSEV